MQFCIIQAAREAYKARHGRDRQLKNSTTGVLLALFLGGLGARHFHLGWIGLGIL